MMILIHLSNKSCIILEANSNYRYKEFDFELNMQAYETFIKEYYPNYYDKIKEKENK